MKNYEKILNVALPITTVAIIICVWAAAAAAADSSLILPSVGETLSAAFSLFARAEFYRAFFATLLRSFLAFLFSFALAFVTAFLSYKNRFAAKALTPLIVFIRVLPTIAVVLMLVLWVNSRVAAAIVTALVIFPTLHENLFAAIGGVDKDLIGMCSLFKVPRRKVFFKVVLPSVAADFISAIGAGLTLSLKLMVAAEVLAHTPYSLGYMLNTAQVYFEIAEMTALVLITVVTGLVIGLIFDALAKGADKI